jgi:hypothetical protein
MENALEHLSDTDDPFAEVKTNMLRCEILCKRVRARIFVTEEGSVEVRKAKAEVHEEAIRADDAYCEATLAFERLRASRARAEIVIDVFRTLEASRRKS